MASEVVFEVAIRVVESWGLNVTSGEFVLSVESASNGGKIWV